MFTKRWWPIRFFTGRYWTKGGESVGLPTNSTPGRTIFVAADVRTIFVKETG